MKSLILAIFVLLCLVPGALRAETINVSDDHGGSLVEYDARWTALAARGVEVHVIGPCQSACTVLLGHIPRAQICVTPAASFGFHLAHLASARETLWAAYQGDIRGWIQKHGGLSDQFIWMRAPDTYQYFKKCRG